MARRVYEELIDDIDPEVKADETVDFGLDGVGYAIDLSDEHAAQLRDDLAKWVTHARKVGGSKPRRAARRTDGDPAPAAVRAWAEANGVELGTRGRIPAEIIERYRREHPEPARKPQTV